MQKFVFAFIALILSYSVFGLINLIYIGVNEKSAEELQEELNKVILERRTDLLSEDCKSSLYSLDKDGQTYQSKYDNLSTDIYTKYQKRLPMSIRLGTDSYDIHFGLESGVIVQYCGAYEYLVEVEIKFTDNTSYKIPYDGFFRCLSRATFTIKKNSETHLLLTTKTIKEIRISSGREGFSDSYKMSTEQQVIEELRESSRKRFYLSSYHTLAFSSELFMKTLKCIK